MIRLQTNCATKEDAFTLLRKLQEDKLVAYGSVWAINSMFIGDNDQIEERQEWRLELMATKIKEDNIYKFLQNNHNYAVPIIWTIQNTRMSTDAKLWFRDKISSF